MKMRSLLVATCAVMLMAAPAAASAAPGSRAPRHRIGRGTSTNWSGYAVDGSNATKVAATWTEAAVKCAARENSWSSPWVGIDGDTDNTVEQTGTDSDCVNGTPYYYAWYEMYPKSAVTAALSVRPGDSITGTVSYAAGLFTLSLKDNNTGASFSTVQTSKKATRSSVEWIVEGPSNGLLSDFDSVPFSGASAAINGQTASLGSLAGEYPITMQTASVAPRAVSSAITGGNAFSVSWQHSYSSGMVGRLAR